MYSQIISELLAGRDLDPESAGNVFDAIVNGQYDSVTTSAIFTALRMKGESAIEIAALVHTIRKHMLRLNSTSTQVVDTCGTGGDNLGTFNISTAAALVIAGTGVHVVKHGNRAVTSLSGSADVLLALGVPVDAGVAWAQRCLNESQFAFCYAPQFHPVLAQLGPLRRSLGFRTILNLVGPLANPASAPYQLIGIGNHKLLDSMAEAVRLLGTSRTVVVRGCDGLDEVTLSGFTDVRIVEGGKTTIAQWSPSDFDLEIVEIPSIHAGNATESAGMIRSVITGADRLGPATRITLANAAAALWCAGHVTTLRDGVKSALDSIQSGRAFRILERLRSTPLNA